jgi:hypothetical protein
VNDDESAEHKSAHNSNNCDIISNYYRSLVDPISEGGGQHKQSKKKNKKTEDSCGDIDLKSVEKLTGKAACCCSCT